jgi:hypothetical protein
MPPERSLIKISKKNAIDEVVLSFHLKYKPKIYLKNWRRSRLLKKPINLDFRFRFLKFLSDKSEGVIFLDWTIYYTIF